MPDDLPELVGGAKGMGKTTGPLHKDLSSSVSPVAGRRVPVQADSLDEAQCLQAAYLLPGLRTWVGSQGERAYSNCEAVSDSQNAFGANIINHGFRFSMHRHWEAEWNL